ncbi:unnamed protein product, partial [Trichogramma brassicae]
MDLQFLITNPIKLLIIWSLADIQTFKFTYIHVTEKISSGMFRRVKFPRISRDREISRVCSEEFKSRRSRDEKSRVAYTPVS